MTITVNAVYATTYEYDALGRVVKAVREDGSSETYTYDKNGNMTTHTATDGKEAESGGRDDGLQDEGGGRDESAQGVSGAAKEPVIKVSRIVITGISGKIAAGKKLQLTAEVVPADAADTSVTWTSSNTKYALVTAGGRVTLKKAGIGKSVKITATAADGSGATADYKIRIMRDAVQGITLSSSKQEVKAGKSLKIKAKVKTTGRKANKKLQWTSSNEKYATVSKSGKVKTKKEGKGRTVTVTARATDGSGKKAKLRIKIR